VEDGLEKMKLTGAAVDFIVGAPAEATPPAALDAAKRVILDTFGVAIAASN
jgi:2-methylcitrate dehydratase PrpD